MEGIFGADDHAVKPLIEQGWRIGVKGRGKSFGGVQPALNIGVVDADKLHAWECPERAGIGIGVTVGKAQHANASPANVSRREVTHALRSWKVSSSMGWPVR